MHDLVAVMDAAGFERATLVAHGLGDADGASWRPRRIPSVSTSLVLVNGYARFARADDYPAGTAPTTCTRHTSTRIESQWGTGVHARRSRAVGRRTGPESSEWWARVERFGATPRVARGAARAILALDVRGVLPLDRRSDARDPQPRQRLRPRRARPLPRRAHPSARATSSVTAPTTGPCRTRISSARSRSSSPARARRSHDADRVARRGALRRRRRVDRVRRASSATARGALAQERFEQIVHTALAAFDGSLESTAGDGSSRPSTARRARSAARRRIRDEARNGSLDVRSGVHVGEIIRRPDGVSGLAVHIGARVSALGRAGRGARHADRARPRRRVGPRVRGARRARAQGRPVHVGALRGRLAFAHVAAAAHRARLGRGRLSPRRDQARRRPRQLEPRSPGGGRALGDRPRRGAPDVLRRVRRGASRRSWPPLRPREGAEPRRARRVRLPRRDQRRSSRSSRSFAWPTSSRSTSIPPSGRSPRSRSCSRSTARGR